MLGRICVVRESSACQKTLIWLRFSLFLRVCPVSYRIRAADIRNFHRIALQRHIRGNFRRNICHGKRLINGRRRAQLDEASLRSGLSAISRILLRRSGRNGGALQRRWMTVPGGCSGAWQTLEIFGQ